MLRSLSAAVAGLRNQQTRMDVIGNNVSNVNTVAFKSGRVTFKEGFAQLVESATRPTSGTGGTGPMQVGLGSQVGSIETMFSQGNLESTGQNTDLAIQGSAFFVVKRGADSFYTRAGNFQVDSTGSLVAGVNGFAVQGRLAVDGKLTPGIGDLKIPFGQIAKATATTTVQLSGNVDASAAVFDKGSAATLDALDPAQRALPANENSFKDMSITVYDSLGTKHELKMVMWKTGPDKWDWKFDKTGMDITAAEASRFPDSCTFVVAVAFAIWPNGILMSPMPGVSLPSTARRPCTAKPLTPATSEPVESTWKLPARV